MTFSARAGRPPLASEFADLQAQLDNVKVIDALNISAAAPFVSAFGAGSATTELSSRLRLTIPTVKAGVLYEFAGSWLVTPSTSGSDWTVYIRVGSTSGSMVGSFYTGNSFGSGALQQGWLLEYPAVADASNVTFFFTAVRNGGAATMSIYNTIGGAQCLFSRVSAIGLSSVYRTVA